MPTQVSNSFVRQYEADVHHVFQKEGAILLPTVRHKPDVVGESTTFQKIGKGVATEKARHGVITPMNQDHTAITCTLRDFYGGDWVDKLDEAKLIHDEQQAIVMGGAWALGRKVDDQIITIFNTTGQTTITWSLSNSGEVRAALLTMADNLWANDVPNDGRCFGALTPRAYAQAMTITSFSSADFVGPTGLPFKEGMPTHKFVDWMNIKWTMHTGLPGKGTATANVYVWHQSSVGYASAKTAGNIAGNSAVSADISWHGDRAAHFVNNLMSGGACLIDDGGVIEGSINDTTAVVAS